MINSIEDRQNRRTGTNLQTVPTPQINREKETWCNRERERERHGASVVPIA